MEDEVRIAGYSDFRAIGRGASSVVYSALQGALQRRVAVKVLHGDSKVVLRRFDREREVVGRLSAHPHIVDVYDAVLSSDRRPCIVMRLYERSLGDRLREDGALHVDEALELMATMCEATQAVHDEGLLHRDIKPQNVLLSRHGPGLADFGIARGIATAEWSQSLAELTPLHAAPETFDDERPTVQGDVWSLGSTLYTSLAGQPPYASVAGERVDRYAAAIRRTALPRILRPDLSEDLWQVLTRALSVDPERRPASAAALAADLRAVGQRPARPVPGTALGEEAPPVVEPLRPPGRPQVQDADGDEGETRVRPGREREREREPEPVGTRWTRRRVVAVGGGTTALLVVLALALLHRVGDEPLVNTTALAPNPAPLPAAQAPTELVAEDRGAEVVLRWVDHTAGRAAYLVSYRGVNDAQASLVPVEPGQTSSTIRGLDPADGYCFRVIAQVSVGSGSRQAGAADTSVRGCVVDAPGTS